MSGYILALISIKFGGSSSKAESQDVEKNKKPLFEVKGRFFDDKHKGNRVIHPTLAKTLDIHSSQISACV